MLITLQVLLFVDWETYSVDITDAVSGNNTITVFLGLADSWSSNYEQKAWFDNVRLSYSDSSLYCGQPESFYGDNIIYAISNVTTVGTEDADLIFGTNGTDTIKGKGGNDCIYGFDGDDLLVGNAGNDTIFGGNGNDTLNGRTGNDSLYGDSGNDTISAGKGDDNLYGGSGIDGFNGKIGNDICHDVESGEKHRNCSLP